MSWFSAKKRGRDDDLIEQERKVALHRLGKKTKASAKGSSQAAKQTKKKPKPRRRKDIDDGDDDDSLEDFIVNDEEEEEGLPEDVSDSSGEEDMAQYLGIHGAKKRVSKLPPHMARSRQAYSVPKKAQFSKKPPAVSAHTKARFSKKPYMNSTKRNNKPDEISSSSSEEDVLEVQPPATQQQRSRFFRTKPGDSLASTAAPSKPSIPRQPVQKTVSVLSSDEDEKDITMPPSRPTKPHSNLSDLGLDSDDAETESPVRHGRLRKKSKDKKVKKQKPKKEPKIILLDDEEDEQVALSVAMSRSMQDQTAGDDDDKHEQAVIDMLQEDESSEGEDDAQDSYQDPAAEEATTVLEQANSLSSQIIDTLSRWSNEGDDNTATMGLIANGALSLSRMGENNKPNDDHSWISKEVMADVCPGVTLADYQLIGINWMALLHGMKCKVQGTTTKVNGILADEMGLGKTCQTIAFLSWLNSRHSSSSQSENDRLPHLVIAPASVLSNWEREFEKFAPHLQLVKYHGTMKEREELQEQLRFYLPGRSRVVGMDPLDVILAPITLFQKEKSDDRSFLRKFRYEYLVVDEAHLLKNARGTRYKSLDKFNTVHRLLLTGTPVQNSPRELLSLLCFLMPLFSRKSLKDYDEDSQNDGGERMLEHFVSIKGGSSDESAYDKLKQLFAPFVLRRRKVDVLSQVMPPKTQRVELVELEPRARKVYDGLLSNHVRAKRQGDATSKDHLFTQLRKAAHHPLLLRTRYTSEAEKQHLTKYFHQYGAFQGEACTTAKVAEELESFNDFQIHLTALELIEENPQRRSDLDRYVLTEDDLFCSSKFTKLRTLLPDLIADDHRILIFSVWTSCLDLLSCLMESMGLKYLRMDGSTPVTERQALIDEFNQRSDIPIFLLSTKACGVGLNLTGADTCLFHDVDFNPMNDVQAEDRCHRIGQTKPVTVIRCVSKDTVDEDIYQMQHRKTKMSQAIMATHGEAEDWNKESARAKTDVLKNALDRFIHSPEGKFGKENRPTINIDRDEV